MTDQRTDDAPLAASKHGEAPGNVAASLPVAKGDSLAATAVTINRPIGELFAYWRDFGNLATFMDNVERIDVRDAKRSHWVVKAPGDRTVQWDAVVTEERENALIAWMSEPGADVPNSGRVEFRHAGARGTVVTVTILYEPPAGIIGKVVAKMFQREPAIQARRDLRRFKQLMEAGEITTSAINRDAFEKEAA